MKKQILFLAMFIAAIFVGTNAFGQDSDYPTTTTKTPAQTLTCAGATTAGHLNPIPGVNYEYIIETDPATVQSVHWFVTDDVNVIATGTYTLTTDRDDLTAGYVYIAETEDGEGTEDDVYDNSSNTDHNINITWQNFDGSDPNAVLLVAYVEGAAGCSDNIEVWRIEPLFLFTLDVLAMDDAGYLETDGTNFTDECVSPVASAIYNLTSLAMDYGQNYVYFSVNAANFVDSWTATMLATASNGADATIIQWAYPDEAIKNDGSGNANGVWHTQADPVIAGNTEVDVKGNGTTVDGAGEYIIVRVLVDHGNIEAPVGPSPANDATVTLTINGIMYDAVADNYTNSALRDVDEGSPECVQDADDTATHTLLPRPDINEDTPAPASFEPKI